MVSKPNENEKKPQRNISEITKKTLDDKNDQATGCIPLQVGTNIIIKEIISNPELNGLRGTIMDIVTKSSTRFVIKLHSDPKKYLKLLPCNLRAYHPENQISLLRTDQTLCRKHKRKSRRHSRSPAPSGGGECEDLSQYAPRPKSTIKKKRKANSNPGTYDHLSQYDPQMPECIRQFPDDF